MSFWVAGTVAVLSVVQADQANKRADAQAEAQERNAERRYRLKSGVAKNQMEEQQGIATEKMTDITRAFLKARGQARAVQAESGVGGNIQKRIESVRKLKASEAKGKVAKEVDTNVINIAQGMLAEKIDTEALIADAQLQKKSSFEIATNLVGAGMSGFASGYNLGSSLNKAGLFGSGTDTKKGDS